MPYNTGRCFHLCRVDQNNRSTWFCKGHIQLSDLSGPVDLSRRHNHTLDRADHRDPAHMRCNAARRNTCINDLAVDFYGGPGHRPLPGNRYLVRVFFHRFKRSSDYFDPFQGFNIPGLQLLSILVQIFPVALSNRLLPVTKRDDPKIPFAGPGTGSLKHETGIMEDLNFLQELVSSESPYFWSLL